MLSHWKCMVFTLICAWLTLQSVKTSERVSRSSVRVDKWTQPIRGEYIPMQFYNAIRSAEKSKQTFQNHLRNFLESLQKNLTTSIVLTLVDDNQQTTKHQIIKLHELSSFFYTAADMARIFARDSENYYEVLKNSSYTLLLQLRQIPSTQPTSVKLLLTNYFAEMEFFHIMFSEIVDEALEYTQDILLTTQKIFTYYADIQRIVLENWNFKSDADCCKKYNEFLQLYSTKIFKCAAGHSLYVGFDVFGMTELTSKYIMRQLEFRIQRLFNCFYFGNYELRCKFLQNAEQDFQVLFSKIEELETYYDIKMKNGRVSASRLRRQTHPREIVSDEVKPHDDCIPRDFPQGQMHESLKLCFYNIKEY